MYNLGLLLTEIPYWDIKFMQNQVCTHHRISVTCNLNSHSCCMLYYRVLLHVKIEIWKSALKLVYILGFLLNERPYWDVNFMHNLVCTPHRRVEYNLNINSIVCCIISCIKVKIKIKKCFKTTVHSWLFVE